MKKLSYPRTILAALLLSASLAPGGAYAANTFTIAVIPDTQNYDDNTKAQPGSNAWFIAQTSYLANHKSDMNLAFVTHVGDVVQHGDGTNGSPGNSSYGAGAEWDRAKEAMDVLAASGVPFGMSIGNHDYDNYSYTTANGKQPLVSNVMWKKYWGSGSPYFAGKSWYGGASDNLTCNSGISSYQTFSAGGKNFLNISLEMQAGDTALAWAKEVIDSHPGYAVIVTTHDYINPPANSDSSLPLVVKASYTTDSASYLKNSPCGWNDALPIWQKFISKNDRIFMVLTGHTWGSTVNYVSKSENIRIDDNDFGHPVYQVLSDYQGNTLNNPGGDGWMRFMEFNMDNNTIHFSTYSPTLDKYAGRDGYNYFNQAPEFSDFTLPMPVQVLNASQFSAKTGGFVYNRATKLYTGNLTITNNGDDYSGTLDVALNNLTSGVTLTNALGQHNGAPYAAVTTSGLAAGASTTIPLSFSDPSNAKINFTPVTFQE
jgi:hypothetical protein